MIKKLERRLILVATAVLAAVLIVTLTVVNMINYAHITDTADRTLTYIADHGGEIPLTPSMPDSTHQPKDNTPPVNNQKTKPPMDFSAETPFSTRYFTVTVTANTTTVDTTHIAAVDHVTAASFADAISERNTSGYYKQYRYLISETENGHIYTFLDCTKDLNNFSSFLRNSIVLCCIGMVVVFLLILLFSGIAVKPFERAYAGQKRFITDAGHELKTPLTVIRSANEVIEMERGADEWTETINSEIDHLTALTEKLVFLARMDEGQTPPGMYDFSLSDVVSEVSQTFLPLSKAKGIPYHCDITPGLSIRGDESLVGTLVSLLLDNAFKYATPGGEVRLSLISHGKRKTLTVSNPTEKPSTDDLNLLFERFYRPDSSRNSSTGGFGIGLAQAKSIAIAHKGKIGAKYENGIIQFHVTFP